MTRDDLGAFTLVDEKSTFGPGTEVEPFSVVKNCEIGSNSKVWRFVNMYGATLGSNCMVGSFVEIQRDVTVGDGCRIQSHAFLCSRVTLEDEVFVSHGAKFVNDVHPPSGEPDQWEETLVQDNAVIGTNATLLPVEVGSNALVGAGAVVIEDVPQNAIVAGNPAEIVGYRDDD